MGQPEGDVPVRTPGIRREEDGDAAPAAPPDAHAASYAVPVPTLLVSGARIARTLDRLAAEIVEHHRGADRLVVVGIRTRGDALADALAARIAALVAHDVPSVGLDVSSYRDDRPAPTATDAPEAMPPLDGATVLLVDDVLHTGRTIRAALDAVVRAGRPAQIRLAVLVDRGAREFPVRADYVGRTLPVRPSERVRIEPGEGFAVYLDPA